VDRRGIPWVSLILAFAFGLLFLLPFPSWHSLVSLVTSAAVLMYAGAPLSLGALRRQVPEATRPYRMPGAAVLAPVAFIIANLDPPFHTPVLVLTHHPRPAVTMTGGTSF
jgi:amino acid transporter